MKKILCISDLHCPAHHPSAIDFLAGLNRKHKFDTVVFMGDEIDGHAISFHDHNPDYPYSPSSELKQAIKTIRVLNRLFPKAYVMESNHGSLVYRRAISSGIPSMCLMPWKDILEVTGWEWRRVLTLQLPNKKLVSFHHGKSAAFLKWANILGHSTVEGHFHTKFGVVHSGDKWSMKTGCLIDNDRLNFDYNKANSEDVILGSGMILDCTPVLARLK